MARVTRGWNWPRNGQKYRFDILAASRRHGRKIRAAAQVLVASVGSRDFDVRLVQDFQAQLDFAI
jgi:hypothetical protein